MASWVIVGLILGAMFASTIDKASQDDIYRACAKDGGVQQVVIGTYAPIKGRVTAVCKDGAVRKVR